MMIPRLETERLAVRRLEAGDLEDVHRLMVAIGWAEDDAETKAARARWLDWTVRSYEEFAALHQPPYGERAVVSHAGAFLGMVGLVPSLGPFGRHPAFGGRADAGHSPEVGMFWAMRPEAEGQGLASEAAGVLMAWAFEHLSLERIVATTERDNARSIAVMRRLGMQICDIPEATPGWEIVGVRGR